MLAVPYYNHRQKEEKIRLRPADEAVPILKKQTAFL